MDTSKTISVNNNSKKIEFVIIDSLGHIGNHTDKKLFLYVRDKKQSIDDFVEESYRKYVEKYKEKPNILLATSNNGYIMLGNK